MIDEAIKAWTAKEAEWIAKFTDETLRERCKDFGDAVRHYRAEGMRLGEMDSWELYNIVRFSLLEQESIARKKCKEVVK